MFENTYGITNIEYSGNVKCYCPLGNDWYYADIQIEIENPEMIPDYCDIDSYLDSLNGQSLILEDICQQIFSFTEMQIKSGQILIKIFTDNATHSPVSISKRK